MQNFSENGVSSNTEQRRLEENEGGCNSNSEGQTEKINTMLKGSLCASLCASLSDNLEKTNETHKPQPVSMEHTDTVGSSPMDTEESGNEIVEIKSMMDYLKENIQVKLKPSLNRCLETLIVGVWINVQNSLSEELKAMKEAIELEVSKDLKNISISKLRSLVEANITESFKNKTTLAIERNLTDVVMTQVRANMEGDVMRYLMRDLQSSMEQGVIFKGHDANKLEEDNQKLATELILSEELKEDVRLAVGKCIAYELKVQLRQYVERSLIDSLEKKLKISIAKVLANRSRANGCTGGDELSEDEGLGMDDPVKDLENVMKNLLECVMGKLRTLMVRMVVKEFNEVWILKGSKYEKQTTSENLLTKYWHIDLDATLDETKSIVSRKLRSIIKENLRVSLKNKINAAATNQVTGNLKQHLRDTIEDNLIKHLRKEIKTALAATLYMPRDEMPKIEDNSIEGEAAYLQKELGCAIDNSFPQRLNQHPRVSRGSGFPNYLEIRVKDAIEKCLAEELEIKI